MYAQTESLAESRDDIRRRRDFSFDRACQNARENSITVFDTDRARDDRTGNRLILKKSFPGMFEDRSHWIVPKTAEVGTVARNPTDTKKKIN